MSIEYRLRSVDIKDALDAHLDMFCVAYGVRLESDENGQIVIIPRPEGETMGTWNAIPIVERTDK